MCRVESEGHLATRRRHVQDIFRAKRWGRAYWYTRTLYAVASIHPSPPVFCRYGMLWFLGAGGRASRSDLGRVVAKRPRGNNRTYLGLELWYRLLSVVSLEDGRDSICSWSYVCYKSVVVNTRHGRLEGRKAFGDRPDPMGTTIPTDLPDFTPLRGRCGHTVAISSFGLWMSSHEKKPPRSKHKTILPHTRVERVTSP